MPTKPNWNYWQKRFTATLWEAVALTCDIEPRNQDGTRGDYWQGRVPSSREFRDRLEVAIDHLQSDATSQAIGAKIFAPLAAGEIYENRPVWIKTFAKRARAIGWQPVPDEFWTLVVPDDGPKALPQWPWGKYETDLLRKMAAAVAKFWAPYDPAIPPSAPTNEQVEEWLVEQGVSQSLAQKMATIMRADGFPTGPRK